MDFAKLSTDVVPSKLRVLSALEQTSDCKMDRILGS